MALPGDVSVRTVVGTFLDFAGAPMTGAIIVQANTIERDVTTSPATSVTPAPLQWTLDPVTGAIPAGKTLPVTDGTLLPNGFTYTATFRLTSANGASRTDSFTFTVPTSASTFDLVAASPAVSTIATTNIVTSVNGAVGDVTVLGAGTAAVNTATVGSAYTIPSPLLFQEHVLTLNQASCTITLPTVGPGLSFMIEFVTSVGSPAITWSPVPRYDSGVAYVPSTVSGSVDIVTFVAFASHWNLLVSGKGMA